MILTLNCGSSSVKYALYRAKDRAEVARGIVERVTIGGSFISHQVTGQGTIKVEHECPDHKEAIKLVFDALTGKLNRKYGVVEDVSAVRAVGHRVVHGGEKFAKSALITDELMATVKELQDLAPLHNPPNIEGIEAARELLPDVPHIAVFDTAFLQTMPPHAYIYAVPYEWYEKYGVRRYGFHGTSHLYVSKRAAIVLGKDPFEVNLVTCHMGNGVSFTAVKNGIAVDHSMGFTPLEGLVMGTRSGDMDPAIIPYISEKEGISCKRVEWLLNHKSGLLGISGKYTDMRDIESAVERGDERAKLALDIYCYRARKYIGAYSFALGRVDAIVFTAGVGEHSSMVRAKICAGLEPMGIEIDPEKNRKAVNGKREMNISTPESRIKVLVIPTNEELVFVEDVIAILEGRYDVHTNFTYSFEHA